MQESEEIADAAPVLDLRRFDEERPGKRAPLLETRRFTESHHMVFDALPIDAETIERAILLDAFEAHAVATLGRLEMRNCRSDGCLELGCPGRIDPDVCDFDNHPSRMARSGESSKR